MANLITDLKRAWRLTKLIRSTELTDEEALQLENVDSIYMEECREIRSSLEKANKLLVDNVKASRATLSKRLVSTGVSINRKLKASDQDNDKRLTDFENSLSKMVLKISQLLDASQKSFGARLEQIGQSSQEAAEMANNVRDYVAKQAEETRRWQEGYDWRIIKNYLLRMVSTMDDVETKLAVYRVEGKPEDFINDFNFLRETLEIHFEEEGVLSFAPEVGEEPDSTRTEVKAVVVITDDNQQVGTIAKVIRLGYEADLGAEVKIIRKAQVSVYKNKE
jgi:molecular chaperone GrpE (heat shock protein)